MSSAGGLDLVVIVAAIAIGAFVKGATGGGLPQIAIPVMAAFLGVEGPDDGVCAGRSTQTWMVERASWIAKPDGVAS